MKNFTLLIAGLICLLSFNTNAQIALTSANMPTPGNKYPAGVDTNASWVNIGAAGVNVTWDFSQAAQHRVDTTFAVAPSATPYSSQFSSSTVALTQNNDDYLFFQNTAGAFKGMGLAGDLLDNGNNLDLQFNPPFDLYQFPTQYGNTFSGSYQATKTVSGSSVGQPSVNQIRLTFTSSFQDTIDGWGTVITPVGQYQALRQHRIDYSYIKVEANLIPSPLPAIWTQVFEQYDTTDSYTWLAEEVDGILVSLTRDSLQNIRTISYSKIPAAPIADFTYVNVSGGVYDFTDASLNNPTTWSWNFGDGSTVSTQQNPTHVYAINDTVYACLTVTNASGSDTYCDSVRVSTVAPNNAPVARTDSASTNSPSAVIIDVAANDLEPDGDPMTVSIVTAPANGTATVNSNGDVVYTPNPTFVGQDSFTYSVCDDGAPPPVLCDTASVYVTVGPNPIFADFTADTSGCEIVLANASQNYSGIASWKYVRSGDTDTLSYLGDTLVIAIQGDVATETFYACVQVLDASNTLYTACNQVVYNLQPGCATGISLTEATSYGVKVYPNPASHQLTVELGKAGGTIRIYSLLGATVVNQQAVSVKQSIDITALETGLYLYTVEHVDGSISQGKLIVE